MSIKSASGLIIGSARAAGFSARPRGFAYPIGGDPGRLLPTETTVEYLVIAGGGAGGTNHGGGGGAGGYRTNFTSSAPTPSPKASGGGGSVESSFTANFGTAYTVTLGAGGAGQLNYATGYFPGSNSVFSTITSLGGGGGGTTGSPGPLAGQLGGSGGGGKGESAPVTAGAGTANQGFAGGNGLVGPNEEGGGGGGAGGVGTTNTGPGNAAGGIGVYSDITGTSTLRGVGGNGNIANTPPGASGTPLTGGGGQGASGFAPPSGSGSGGSGVVVLRVPDTAAAVFSGGVATRSYTVSGYNIYEVQATTTTGETVTFYPNAFLAEYLVVAGGGGGGWYCCNFAPGAVVVVLEVILASADAVAMAVVTGQAYPVIVGGWWAGVGTSAQQGGDGSNSQFASIIQLAVVEVEVHTYGRSRMEEMAGLVAVLVGGPQAGCRFWKYPI
jgi:hypothetical protein